MDGKIISRLTYEDVKTEDVVEIFGLEFELKNVNTDEIIALRGRKDEGALDLIITSLIGEDSIGIIDKKMKEDGEGNLSIKMKFKIVNYLLDSFAKSEINQTRNSVMSTKNILKKYGVNFNREQTRSFKKNYNRGYNARNRRRY